MEKTILIGMNNRLSVRVTRWLIGLTALLFLSNGILQLYPAPDSRADLIFGVLMIVTGIFYGFFGLTAFSKKSGLALKIKVNEKAIELKNSFWKPSTSVNWAEIRSVELGNYEISFELDNLRKVFHYNSNPETSMEIKETIREFAELRNIRVTGG